MTQSLNPTTLPPAFPDHTQLPDSDGTFVHNFLAHPQSIQRSDGYVGGITKGIYCELGANKLD